MINAHLMWSLESQGLLSEQQCSFRKNHSMLDHLVHFKTFIRNAFVKKEHVLTISFDVEKAYNTTWKHGILADLWDLSFRGHLPRVIQSFLSERYFNIGVGCTLSELHEQEMGVPQGSNLPPALFSIKINNIVKAVLKGTDCSLFIADFVCERKDIKQSGESYAAVNRKCDRTILQMKHHPCVCFFVVTFWHAVVGSSKLNSLTRFR